MLLLVAVAIIAAGLACSLYPVGLSLDRDKGDRGNGGGNNLPQQPAPVNGSLITRKAYVCGDQSPTITVLDTNNGSVIGEITSTISLYGVTASHDGNYVYAISHNYLFVIDTRTDQIIKDITLHHTPRGYLVVSPDDCYIYVVCFDGMLVIARDGEEWKPVAFTPGATALGIGISPDGRYVLTTDWRNCSLQVFNTADRRIEKTINLLPEYYAPWNISLQGMPIEAAGQAGGIAVSPDGSRALVGIWFGSFLPVVDLKTLALERTVPLYNQSHRCAVYSPDGTLVYLMRYDDGMIVVLNGSTLEEVKYFGVGARPISIAITPDGRYLYVSYEWANMELYRLPDGSRVRTLDFIASRGGTNIAFTTTAF